MVRRADNVRQEPQYMPILREAVQTWDHNTPSRRGLPAGISK